MSVDFNGPAAEVFQILRSYNYEVVLYDEDGNQVYEPEEGRRFFCKPTNMLCSIVDDGDNSSTRLYLSQSANINKLKGLIDTLRHMAPKYNMLFNVRKYGRELSPKDFSTNHSVKEAIATSKKKKVEESMKVFEGMYGTTRSSYVKLENARMIVRHDGVVREDLIGARGRNIHAIFVENAIGERFKFPVNNLSGARAMTQHVNHGGGFNDAVGESIINMAEDFANLATANRYIRANGPNLNEGAEDIRKKVREKMAESRRMFERMFRPGGYKAEAAKINERASTLSETEEEVNEYINEIENLRGLLTVEGVELSEGVYKSVAKALGENSGFQGDDDEAVPGAGGGTSDGMLDMDEAREKTAPMISVMGRPVSADAWNKLKAGQIDLRQQPEVGFSTGKDDPGKPPLFKDRSSELAMKLGAIVKVCGDDSMANFLSYVNDALLHAKDPTELRNLRRIGVQALRAAHLPMSEGMMLNSPVIKEFNEWIAGHSPDAILMQEEDEELDEDVPLGSPQTITFQANVNGQNVTVTATNHPAVAGDNPSDPSHPGSDRAANLSFDNIMTQDGRRIDPRSLDASTQQQLQQQAVQELGERVGDDTFHEDEEPRSFMHEMDEDEWSLGAKHLGFARGEDTENEALMSIPSQQPDAEVGAGGMMPMDPSMGGDNMEIEFGGCGDDNGDLTGDDVILPTNMGNSLEREVSPEIDSPEKAIEIDRLRQLAGMARPGQF